MMLDVMRQMVGSHDVYSCNRSDVTEINWFWILGPSFLSVHPPNPQQSSSHHKQLEVRLLYQFNLRTAIVLSSFELVQTNCLV
jgi:hypothetical protein